MRSQHSTSIFAILFLFTSLLAYGALPRVAFADVALATATATPKVDCAQYAKTKGDDSAFLSMACKINKRYGHIIEPIAHLHEYDKNLITAVIVVESNGNTNATSHVGAKGLMQLMPSTARSLGTKDIRDPMENILAGTTYLRALEEDYGFLSVEEALLAYNMGPRRAAEWLDEEGHSATDASYVKKVMRVYHQLEAEDARLHQEVKKSSTEELLQKLLLKITKNDSRSVSQPELLSARRLELETKED